MMTQKIIFCGENKLIIRLALLVSLPVSFRQTGEAGYTLWVQSCYCWRKKAFFSPLVHLKICLITELIIYLLQMLSCHP